MNRKLLLITTLAVLIAPGVSRADSLIDFGIVTPTAGTISYDGTAGGALVGSGITVDTVTGINTPLNNGVTLTITGGVLSFTTGSLTGTTATTWSFGGGAGSSITITGAIAAIPIAATTLLSGAFGDATVTTFGSTFKIAGSSFTDTKNTNLMEFYGLGGPSTPWPGNFNISFNTNPGITPPSGFTSTEVLSGDVVNTVPEPGTLALFGTGLVSIAGLIRRKLTS